MPRIIGWWLVPLSWLTLALVDWYVYGDPLAYVRVSPDAGLLTLLAAPFEPTAGFAAAFFVLLPWAVTVIRTPPAY